MRQLLQYFTATLLALSFTSALHSEDTDTAEIRESLENDFSIITEALNDKKLAESQKSEIIMRQLRNRLALGPIASKAIGNLGEGYSFEDIVNFTQEFEDYLLYFSLDRILVYGGSKIEIESIEPTKSGRYAVTTIGRELKGSKQKHLTVEGRATNRYLVEKISGEWRIVDITLGGVNVADNFHSQFEATIKRSDAKTLLKTIRDSNKRNRKK